MLGVADLSPLAVVFGLVGFASVITASVVVVLGQRSKTLAQIQDQTINALDARVADLELQNAALIRRETETRVALVERDKVIDSLRGQIKYLGDIVTSKDAIDDLTREVRQAHEQILEALASR
jgi:predicted PurR-regulated permease PerM